MSDFKLAHIVRHFNPILKRSKGRKFTTLPHME